MLWAEIEDTDDAAAEVFCWNVEGAASRSECPKPRGTDGLAWVLPSFRPDRLDCVDELEQHPEYNRPVMWTCEQAVEGRAVSVTYSQITGQRAALRYFDKMHGDSRVATRSAEEGWGLATTDEPMRPQTTMESLAGLKTPFRAAGKVTAGNAAGINDGATAALLAEEETAKELGLPIKMRLVSYSFVGVEPEVMGAGPIPATEKALKQAGLTIDDITDVIEGMQPLDGAVEFLDWLRSNWQVIVLSDTFSQFAGPMMEKLDRPTLFCHSLVIDEESRRIADWTIRLENQKCRAVEALRAMNFNVIAIGDSYNDTSMLAAANTGILLNPPQNVTDEFPQHLVATDYTELRAAIEQAASAIGE